MKVPEMLIKVLFINSIVTSAPPTQITAGEGTESALVESIENSQTNLENAEDAYSAEVSRRQQASAAHQQKVQDLHDAINACDEATQLMREARQIDLPASSFLQTKETALKGHILKINEKLKRMSLTGTVVPFLKALVEMTQDGINWQAIDQIIQLIDDLRESIRAELATSISEDNADASYSAQLLESLHNSIESSRSSIQANSALLQSVRDNLVTLRQNLSDFQSSLQTNTNNLNALNSAWEATSSNFNAAIDRLQRDIQVLGDALAFLAAQE